MGYHNIKCDHTHTNTHTSLIKCLLYVGTVLKVTSMNIQKDLCKNSCFKAVMYFKDKHLSISKIYDFEICP